MNLEWTRTNDWHVARFTLQNLDDCEAESKAILAFVEALPMNPKMAISFRGEWVSSRVLGLIMATRNLVAKRGGQFAITSPGPKIMEVLKITKSQRRHKSS